MKNVLRLAILTLSVSACNGSTFQDAASDSVTATDTTEARLYDRYTGEALVPSEDRPILGIVALPPGPLHPTEWRTSAQINVAACTRFDGTWACGTNIKRVPVPKSTSGSSPILPASWTVPNWCINTALGNDTNACTSCGSAACATWDEIAVHRLGALDPYLPQKTKFTLDAPQTLGSDYIWFRPRLAEGSSAQFIGTLQTVQASITGLTVTPKTITTGGGTLLQLAGMPAGTIKNMIVQDINRSSYAIIDSMSGSTATMQQPIPGTVLNLSAIGVPALAEDNGWASSDTYATFTAPLANLKEWTPDGSAVTAAPFVSVGQVQWVTISDPSPAFGSYALVGNTGANILSMAVVQGSLNANTLNGLPTTIIAGTTYTVGSSIVGTLDVKPASNLVYGGGVLGSTLLRGLTSVKIIDGDTICHGPLKTYAGTIALGSVYVIAGSNIFWGLTLMSSTLWGPGNVLVPQGSTFVNNAGTWTANLLVSGSIAEEGNAGIQTTGCAFTTGSPGVWNCGTTLSAVNLDAAQNLALSQPNSWSTMTR